MADGISPVVQSGLAASIAVRRAAIRSTIRSDAGTALCSVCFSSPYHFLPDSPHARGMQ